MMTGRTWNRIIRPRHPSTFLRSAGRGGPANGKPWTRPAIPLHERILAETLRQRGNRVVTNKQTSNLIKCRPFIFRPSSVAPTLRVPSAPQRRSRFAAPLLCVALGFAFPLTLKVLEGVGFQRPLTPSNTQGGYGGVCDSRPLEGVGRGVGHVSTSAMRSRYRAGDPSRMILILFAARSRSIASAKAFAFTLAALASGALAN